jgi:transposase
MLDYTLPRKDLDALRRAHREARNVREAYRINAVILLAQGWSAADVATALLIDADTVRAYFKRFKRGGLDELLRMNFVGSDALLSSEQLAELDAHLETHPHQNAASVARWVAETFGVHYTVSGMTAVLRRLGYTYKKPKLVPGKADAERQEAHVQAYEDLKQNKDQDDVILFMDATHPLHNPVMAGAWIKRGKVARLPSNTGRARLNINGAIDIARLTAVVRFDDTINAASTLALFEQIEAAYPKAGTITVILDNARYYRSKDVAAYLEGSRIQLMFLPPYAPNLNLIERFWKFFKKKVLYNTYYETFHRFRAASERFFEELPKYARELRTLLTENFEIIRN